MTFTTFPSDFRWDYDRIFHPLGAKPGGNFYGNPEETWAGPARGQASSDGAGWPQALQTDRRAASVAGWLALLLWRSVSLDAQNGAVRRFMALAYTDIG